MNIQSLSVVIPNKVCINNCPFCVSKMHGEQYKNQMDSNLPFYDLYESDYIKRLEFARDNGCNTVMLTGNSEPQQNRGFLQRFGTMNNNLSTPFRWIEMQTTGVNLDENYLRFLRNHVGVNTISLSISSFDDEENYNIIRTKGNLPSLIDLCRSIKKYDFNLRLSLNLTKSFNTYEYRVKSLFSYAKEILSADQVTFRVLYFSGDRGPQAKWVEENRAWKNVVDMISKYILENGIVLEKLPFGAIKYDVHGMGVVLDDDCMSQEIKDSVKYLILRENCKLYSKWDTQASLIF